jgi:hypothetical protein
MDENLFNWQEQFRKNSTGAREVVRTLFAMFSWFFFGFGLAIVFDKFIIASIFIVIYLAFASSATRWKPAWNLYRKILGNSNLPIDPMPRK